MSAKAGYATRAMVQMAASEAGALLEAEDLAAQDIPPHFLIDILGDLPAGRDDQRRRRLIDRDGCQALTMRRLAAETGIAPTTLYHHVRDKEDLLRQLLDDYADQIPRPGLPRDTYPRGLRAIVDGLLAPV